MPESNPPSEPANASTPPQPEDGSIATALAGVLDRINRTPHKEPPDTDREDRNRRLEAMHRAFAYRARYRDCTLKGFRVNCDAQRAAVDSMRAYAEDLKAQVARGSGLLLYGPPGTGKDHLLAAAIRAAILHYGLTVRWENGMDLFGEVRDRISEERSERDLIRSLVNPDILAISDPLPPFGGLTEFQSSVLFRVIDGRYSAGKSTWVTVNAKDRAEAEQRMCVQNVDRLSDSALVIFCNWPSHRRPQGK